VTDHRGRILRGFNVVETRGWKMGCASKELITVYCFEKKSHHHEEKKFIPHCQKAGKRKKE